MTQIPPVKKICHDLGFGIYVDRPDHQLKEASQTWRRQYVTDLGVPGKDLREWRDLKTQIDLTAMVDAFLEKGGYGEKLWPSRNSPSRRIPEYPRDRKR